MLHIHNSFPILLIFSGFFQCSILKPIYFEKYFSWTSSRNAARSTVSDIFALCAAAPALKRQRENSENLIDESIRWFIFIMENLKAMRCIRPEVAVLVPNSWFVVHALAGWSWFDPVIWILHQILHNLLCFLEILFPHSCICSRVPTVACCCFPDLSSLSSL